MNKLYVNKLDHFLSYLPRVAADYAHFPMQVVVLSQEEQDSADFKAKKGHGKFPILETASGAFIYESNAIA